MWRRNSFPVKTLLAVSYLEIFAFSEQSCWSCSAGNALDTFEVARQASSLKL